MSSCTNLTYHGPSITCPANATLVYSDQHCRMERVLLTLDNPTSGGGPVVLGGDVTGSAGSNIVSKLAGNPLSPTAPTTGQVLAWNGTAWTPTTITTAPSSTTNVLSILGNNVTSTVNGVASTIALPSTSATTNTLTLTGTNLTSTVNGVVSNVIALPASTLSTLSLVLPITPIANGDNFQVVSEKLQGQLNTKQNILTIQDESLALVTNPSTINFVGAGVTSTNVGGVVTVSVPGGATYASPLTAKGDIYVRTATGDIRLPVGTDGFALVADSSTTTGLAYKNITPVSDYISPIDVVVPANGTVTIPHNLNLSSPFAAFTTVVDVSGSPAGETTPEKITFIDNNNASFKSVSGGTYRFIIRKAI